MFYLTLPFEFHYYFQGTMMKLKLITACIFWLTAIFYWPEDLDIIFIAGTHFYR